VTYFYILESLCISGTGKVRDRDFEFGVRIDRQAYKPKNAQVGRKGHGVLT